MYHTKPRSTAGFTLIELLLSLTITATLLFAVTAFLYSSVSARVQEQSITEVDTQSNAALSLITQTVRNAVAVAAPTSGSSASLSLTTVTPLYNPSVFRVTNGTLELAQGAGAVIPLTNSHIEVSNFTVSNLSRSGTPAIIQIRFTAARRSAGTTAAYTYQKTFAGSAALRQP